SSIARRSMNLPMHCASSNLKTLPFFDTISPPNFGSMIVILHSAQLSLPYSMGSDFGVQPLRTTHANTAVAMLMLFLPVIMLTVFLLFRFSKNHTTPHITAAAITNHAPVSGYEKASKLSNFLWPITGG